MAGIQASGVGSGLDIASLVSQLVAAERAPLDARIARRETAATVEISGLAALKGGMTALRDGLAGLNSTSAFNARTASSSETTVFTATASSEVQPGEYGIEVINLATAHKLASDAFVAGRDAVVGTGTLTIKYGDKTLTVAIDSEHDTLTQIRDAINSAEGNDGVSASILNEAGGSRLMLSARSTGADNAITITQSGGDGGLAQLVFDPAAPLANTMAETPAVDAWIRVNGYDFYSAGNTVTGAVDGLSITLKKPDDGVLHTLTVANDTGSAVTRIKKFVSDYNALAKIFGNLQAYDPVARKGGALLGDAFVRGIQDQLRRDLSGEVEGTRGVYTSLAALGIRTDGGGQLTVDDTRLKAALAADFDNVAQLFAGDDGVAKRMYDRLDAALKTDAQLAVRNETLNKTVKSLTKDKEDVDRRMEGIEARYRAQFTALDKLMSQMQTTGDFLTQQLAALNNSG
jgi:flagellar hook-associated protein 2